ncbi:MAG: c-type cytochrome [Sphingomonadales bacterium]|nr:c-type cytochrome [Sphingomonadales bacterium]MDE2170873.1 c-type cytochrome [Sphingomonadales bacterium]
MKRTILTAMAAAATSVTMAPAAAQTSAGDAAHGRTLYQAQCAACHSVVAGKSLVGPSLKGVVGRVAGKSAGFAYSPAMSKAGFKWDKARLDAYITAPAKTVPGNRMPYGGMPDSAQRRDLLAYLASNK